MLLFYIATFVFKSFLVNLVYQDLRIELGLPMLNFLQILMLMSLLAMIKITVFGNNYSNVKTYKTLTTAEKVVSEIAGVFALSIFMVVYFVAKVLL